MSTKLAQTHRTLERKHCEEGKKGGGRWHPPQRRARCRSPRSPAPGGPPAKPPWPPPPPAPSLCWPACCRTPPPHLATFSRCIELNLLLHIGIYRPLYRKFDLPPSVQAVAQSRNPFATVKHRVVDHAQGGNVSRTTIVPWPSQSGVSGLFVMKSLLRMYARECQCWSRVGSDSAQMSRRALTNVTERK